jgi:hypothetical protein
MATMVIFDRRGRRWPSPWELCVWFVIVMFLIKLFIKTWQFWRMKSEVLDLYMLRVSASREPKVAGKRPLHINKQTVKHTMQC